MAGEIKLNSVTLATESGGTISLSGDVDTLTPIKTALNASGSAPIYACRAWVNFNGAFGSSPFTIANGGIRASGNVSSITDNTTGDYTLNFTTAMPNANYSTIGTSSSHIANNDAYKSNVQISIEPSYTPTISSVTIITGYPVSNVEINSINVNVCVFC